MENFDNFLKEINSTEIINDFSTNGENTSLEGLSVDDAIAKCVIESTKFKELVIPDGTYNGIVRSFEKVKTKKGNNAGRLTINLVCSENNTLFNTSIFLYANYEHMDPNIAALGINEIIEWAAKLGILKGGYDAENIKNLKLKFAKDGFKQFGGARNFAEELINKGAGVVFPPCIIKFETKKKRMNEGTYQKRTWEPIAG
jgi:hypothetical protein